MREEEYDLKKTMLYLDLARARTLVKEKEILNKIHKLESEWYLQTQAKHRGDDDANI